MPRNRTITTFFAAFVAVLFLVPATAPAQVKDFDEDGDILRSSEQRRKELQAKLERADLALALYITQSVDAIHKGHQAGFAQFRTWYRADIKKREAAQAREDFLKSLFKDALAKGLDFIFPGGGTFVEKAKSFSVSAYSTAADAVSSFSPGDVSQFLAEHDAAMQQVLLGLLDLRQDFRTDHKKIYDAAVMDYIFAREEAGRDPSDTSPGPSTRRLLTAMGLPDGADQKSAKCFEERILSRQIRGVLRDGDRKNLYSANDLDHLSKALALKHLYNDPDYYCAQERQAYSFWWSRTCRRWSFAQQKHPACGPSF